MCAFQGHRMSLTLRRQCSRILQRFSILAAGNRCSASLITVPPGKRRGSGARNVTMMLNTRKSLPAFVSSCSQAEGSSAAHATIVYELILSLVAKDTKLEARELLEISVPEARETWHRSGILRGPAWPCRANIPQNGPSKTLLGSRSLLYDATTTSEGRCALWSEILLTVVPLGVCQMFFRAAMIAVQV